MAGLAATARDLLRPSLRRTLIARSLAISIVPIVVISVLAFQVSQQLLEDRFDDEAEVVANATSGAIQDRITLAQRGSNVLAALPEVRDLTEARDIASLRQLLIRLKSRLALDLAMVSDAEGNIVASAQDFTPGERLPPELAARALAHAEQSYVIYSEPGGLMIRSLTPISTSIGVPPGYVETGSLLDDSFLRTQRASSDSEIAIVVGRTAKVSTVPSLDVSSLPPPSDTSLLVGPAHLDAMIGGRPYRVISTLVQSHSAQPQELAVFLPLAPLQDAQREVGLVVLLGGGLLVLLAIYFSWRTARSLTQPLTRLAGEAQRIEAGDLATTIATGSRHEIGQLERSFGSMVGALQSRDARNEALVNDLRSANVKLEELSRLKSEFIANVSHELRTPMNAIIGYTDFMLEGLNGPVNEQQRADLDRVRIAAHNLLGIINGLLDIAKIEAGQMDVVPQRFSVFDLVNEVVELLGERARAKDLVLRSEVDPRLPTAWADPFQVRQVLVNLVGNAIKFTNEGEVVIGANDTDGVVIVDVKDSGEGIPPDAQAFIFDEFRQADGSSRRRHGGTGLGLAIARRLVWMNGGKIWVESAPSAGARFFFTLSTQPHSAERPPEPAALR